MGKFDTIVNKYTQLGVSESNLQFAIDAVKNGTKREHIIENLTQDYRGMDTVQANSLLEELFSANGGEFKKENQGGYLFGALFLLLGLSCAFFIYYAHKNDERLMRPVLIWSGAIIGTAAGLFYIIAALMGKYRDENEPFKE